MSGDMAGALEGLAAVMEADALARAAQEMNLLVVAGEVLLAVVMVSHAAL